jgi:hypothetical protein
MKVLLIEYQPHLHAMHPIPTNEILGIKPRQHRRMTIHVVSRKRHYLIS